MELISSMAGRLRHYHKQRGLVATIEFLGTRVFRHQITCVYEADLRRAIPPAEWSHGERCQVIGPEDEVTPRVKAFLGGAAYECMAGLRNGDRLFLIAEGDELLHRGYVMFTSRSNKLIGADRDAPLIGYCYTAASARGRGLYRRALIGEMQYLRQHGYKRVVIDTHPANVASRKGIEAAGFTYMRTIDAWILLNKWAVQRSRSGGNVRWRVLSV